MCKPQQAAASLWYCGINQARCGKAANIGCPDDTLVLQDVSASNGSQSGSSAFPPCPAHAQTTLPANGWQRRKPAGTIVQDAWIAGMGVISGAGWSEGWRRSGLLAQKP